MKAIAILAHLMDSKGILDQESLSRIEAALKLDKTENFNFILTSGWDYRKDSNLKIGNVIADKLINEYFIERERVIVDVCSRDTVGDAFFLRKNAIIPFSIQNLVVVTSDYHVRRVDIIFKKFFSPHVKVKVIGVDLGLSDDLDLKKNEENSLVAFSKTFKNVEFSSDREICRTLRAMHPFYNGKIYEKIDCD